VPSPSGVPTTFRVRGVVEGFYGPPWTWDARRIAVRTLAAHGANAYVYAPKDDPRHRASWRDSYPDATIAEFDALADTCRDAGVTFGFALSPGLDIRPDDPADVDALLAKFAPMTTMAPWFVLALDDIPVRGRDDLGREHATLVARVTDRFPDVQVTIVPTEYVGTDASPYLDQLTDGLPAGVDVMWTGRTVCSPTITRAEAEARAAALGGRPPLVWDNYPVNDAVMERALHLAPYTGRDADLGAAVTGVLLNPMRHARASLVALVTAMMFLTAPDTYDADAAWDAAVREIGGEQAPAWRALGEACWWSPLHAPQTVPLARLVDVLEAKGPQPAVLAELLAVAETAAALPVAIGTGAAVDGVTPWVEQVAREGAVIRAAAKVLDATTTGAGGERSLHRAFALLATWDAAREGAAVAYGPRFGLVPAVIGTGPGTRLDVDAAVTEDGSAVDRLARLALAAYQATAAGGST